MIAKMIHGGLSSVPEIDQQGRGVRRAIYITRFGLAPIRLTIGSI